MNILTFLVMICCLMTAGCATITPHSLSQNDVRQLKLVESRTVFSGDFGLYWEAAIPKVSHVKTETGERPLTTEEVRAEVRREKAEEFSAHLQSKISPLLQGSRPVRAETTIYRLDMPSALRRIAIGGSPSIMADTVFVDAKTGAVIMTAKDIRAFIIMGNGALGVAFDNTIMANSDPYKRLMDEYTKKLSEWLLKNE